MFPEPVLDYGIVTSGSCATPEAQAEFDRDQVGKPPPIDDGTEPGA